MAHGSCRRGACILIVAAFIVSEVSAARDLKVALHHKHAATHPQVEQKPAAKAGRKELVLPAPAAASTASKATGSTSSSSSSSSKTSTGAEAAPAASSKVAQKNETQPNCDARVVALTDYAYQEAFSGRHKPVNHTIPIDVSFYDLEKYTIEVPVKNVSATLRFATGFLPGPESFDCYDGIGCIPTRKVLLMLEGSSHTLVTIPLREGSNTATMTLTVGQESMEATFDLPAPQMTMSLVPLDVGIMVSETRCASSQPATYNGNYVSYGAYGGSTLSFGHGFGGAGYGGGAGFWNGA